MAISLSHGGSTIYYSKTPSHEISIGTLGGLFTIQRENSKGWRVSRKSLEGQHVSSIMTEPTSGLTFVGVHKGSIYASANSGKTWELRDKGLTKKDIYSLNHVQREGKVKIYAGTEPAHLFESDDLGESWHEFPSLRSVSSVPKWTFPAPPHDAHVKHITFDPSDPKVIYASIEVGGLLRSEDGGSSWKDLQGFYADVHRLVIRPSNPKWMYVTGGDGIYHSQDGGTTWEHLTTREMRVGYPDALIIHPHREDLMFTAGAINSPAVWRTSHDADSTIARSRDSGRNWEVIHQGLPQHIRGNFEAMTMDVWNGSFSLFAGTTDGEIFYSENEGNSWEKIADGLPPISKGGHYINLQGVRSF